MAGSYNHIITRDGNFVSNERFVIMIENLGDAYEMAEEMYGMIWWLAHMATNVGPLVSTDLVEMARQNYTLGLEVARQTHNKKKES